MIRIDIGGGYRSKAGFLRADANVSLRPDIVADAHHLPFRDNVVNEIYCSHVLEHLEDPKVAIREIMRVLKPKYAATFIVPNICLPWTMYIMWRYGAGWGRTFNPFECHKWIFTCETLERLLKDAGFITSKPLRILDAEKHWGIEWIFYGTKLDIVSQLLRFGLSKKMPFLNVITVLNRCAYAKPDKCPDIKI